MKYHLGPCLMRPQNVLYSWNIPKELKPAAVTCHTMTSKFYASFYISTFKYTNTFFRTIQGEWKS